MTTPTTTPITADSRLSDLAARHPAHLDVLTRHGMDACCGGALTLAQAAAAHREDLAALLAELREAEGV